MYWAVPLCFEILRARTSNPCPLAFYKSLPGPLDCTVQPACLYSSSTGLRAVSESERILTYRRSLISEREFSELHCLQSYTSATAAAAGNGQPITDYFSGRPGFQACLQSLETFPFLLSSQIPNHYDNSLWILSENCALNFEWNSKINQKSENSAAAAGNGQPITDYFLGRPGFQACLQNLETFPFLLSSQIPNHYGNCSSILSKNCALHFERNC